MIGITNGLPSTLPHDPRSGFGAPANEEAKIYRRERIDDEWWLALDDYIGEIEEDLQREWAAFDTDNILVQDEFGEWGVL